MNLLKLFSSYAPNRVFLAILAGAISGVAYAMLIPVMMTALSGAPAGLSVAGGQTTFFWGIEVTHAKSAALFLMLCVLIMVTRTASQVFLARISMDVTTRLRRSLYDRIANTSIAALEQRTSGQLIQTLTTDVQRIVGGAGMIPEVLIQVSTFVGLMGFLSYLNIKVFTFVLCSIVFGVVTYQLPMMFGVRYFIRARNHMDELQEGFKGLVEGAKELKLNRAKQQDFLQRQLLDQEDSVIHYEKTGFTIVKLAQNYGDLISYFSMGVIAFIYVNYHAISVAELTGVIMVLLYITGPVAAMLNVLPEFARAKVSLNKVQALFDELPIESGNKELQDAPKWQTLSLNNIRYQHLGGNAGKSFSIGPVSAHIKRGEITFIVGGNGSGKSTLSKVLSLHYPASSGDIAFDDIPLTPDNLNSYRQQIACIYSDYYLFKKVHGRFGDEDKLKQQVDALLELLELKGKVQFQDGSFSSLKLSDGQRRRLALLVAFLDDKDLYVFDEWAADQDPHFKKVFYFDILPSLKARGKAVVAISHDDRYFHIADQILMMEDGHLVDSRAVSESLELVGAVG
jgi:putative ATP-binding cassette transporter